MRAARGIGSGPQLASALQERGKIANIHASSEDIRRIPVNYAGSSESTMRLGARLVLALFLATVQLSGTFAEDVPPANVVRELVPFSSDEGLARLARSTAKVDFPALANQFEAQSNPAFCGPTSAAIVLNAIRGRSADLPRD
jgi:phytochelatin synthase